MKRFVEIRVTDREEWRKMFRFEERSIIYIGADETNDIVLDSSRGVAPRHAQLIWAPGRGYRLVNLGDGEIRLDTGSKLSAHAFTDVVANSKIMMGDFELTFWVGGNVTNSSSHVPRSIISVSNASKNIELELSLPRTKLVPGRELEGQVTVRNLGKESGVQFKLDVTGISSECYDDVPGPILSSASSRSMPLRLCHTASPTPLAGKRTLTIRASAQDAYPGEVVLVSQDIHILPYYHHTMRIISIK